MEDNTFSTLAITSLNVATAYLHYDPLGSVIFISGEDGAVVAGSWTHYLPFGGYDNGPPTADITDFGYTGHRHNDDLGLIYMNARYYDPFVRRFVSADAIVPDPVNPQSFNRYVYVNNNPIGLIDPTGHRECGALEDCSDPLPYSAPPQLFISPFLNFTGEGWTIENKQMLHEAADTLANRMARAANSQVRLESKMLGATYTPLSAEEIFLRVFGGPITLHLTDEACTVAQDCVAWVSRGETTVNINLVTNPYLIIHEIFHILDLTVLGDAANQALAGAQSDANFPNRPNLDGPSRLRWGFAGGNFSNWQKSRSGLSGEEFADMGIGWTYNQWERSRGGNRWWSDDGRARAHFMNNNMALWLSLKIEPWR